ncbi:MAG TPA: glycosyltransferase, partial [Actinomycetota bacterium]
MLRSGSDVSRGGAAVSVLPEALVRATARGKFLFAGGEKLYVRGVTYGAFRPDEAGEEYTDPAKLEADFAAMAASGVNTVRIPHTTPPRSLLDVAARHGLRVMVGLSCEQYVGWLIDRKGAPDVDELVRQKVRSVAGHPALLCYALGNEIPATVARWLGARRIERYLRRLADLVRAEDPGALVTYVNYPTTEYLDLSFLDLLSFNVYLEEEDRFRSYLARLQNLAGDRPLLMTEIGLDSLRNGRDAQARALAWQIGTSFATGCAGVVVFSWTDEWHRAGAEVDDWEFGITDRDRRPKPALEAVRGAFTRVPFPEDVAWPRISVVVCSYNGERTIRECLDGLRGLDYPDHEVIVVDDGSTDSTAEIAARYPFRLIRTENRGLSSARNAGLAAATGEIVAYIDDDAYPDPHWLRYLAHAFLASDHAGIGGPNIPPPGDGTIAEAVAAAPGGPIHVLLSDDLAEHIPGCNMAFRRTALEAIGGFDTRFRVAGDDVDLCWRLQDAGHTIGFSPPAVVWHHRRSSVRAYWRQQKGYGKAEALL